MEDGEYYHMMLNDLERLERVHHHTSHPSEHSELLTRNLNQQSSQNPFISGIRVALNNALKSGLEKLHVGRRGREEYWRKRGSWSSRGSGDN
ncbi:hypothetical protein QBC43DRAFT_55016 [Cladorrhinum sp. PSN259]|nr:hypothetical protein QBC43DRAFT_55016 [Cladorrhinum sp. PSN259]